MCASGWNISRRWSKVSNVHGLISKLVSIVPEYSPSEELMSLAEVDQHDLALAYRWERKHLNSLGRRRSLTSSPGNESISQAFTEIVCSWPHFRTKIDRFAKERREAP